VDEAASPAFMFASASPGRPPARGYLVGNRSGFRIHRSLAHLAAAQNGGLLLIGAFLTTGAAVPLCLAVRPLVTVTAFHVPFTGVRTTEPLSTWTVVTPLR
jgi:hypothetical protein